MKKIVLTMISMFIPFSLASESFAEPTCTYNSSKHTLTISGAGEFTSCAELDNNKSDITSIVIDDNVNTIGGNAFMNITSVTSLTIGKNVSYIKGNAFHGMTGLTSLTIPNSVTKVDHAVFYGMSGLENLIISDGLNTGEWSDMTFWNFPSSAKVACLGDVNTCKSSLSKYANSFFSKLNPSRIISANDTQCNSSENYYYTDNGCQKLPNTQELCEGAEFIWADNTCKKAFTSESDTCADGQVFWDEQCMDEYPFAKKRWTPAEAAEWLHDGNDNFVVITFKK